jgi:predicted transcriptional regulator
MGADPVTRCPHCKLPMGRVAGAPATLACVRCEGSYSALSERQRDALEALRAHDGPVSSQAIADDLGISRQAATKLLNRLEAMGVIRDEPVMVRSGKWRVVA